jgi:hypothetical protein
MDRILLDRYLNAFYNGRSKKVYKVTKSNFQLTKQTRIHFQ